MILKIVVLLGIAIYLASNGLWFFAGLAVVSVIPRLGLLTAIALGVLLFVNGNIGVALIVGGLITFNLAGNYYMDPMRKFQREMDKLSRRGKRETRVYIELSTYARKYLAVTAGLSDERSEKLFHTREFLLVLEEILKTQFIDRETDTEKGNYQLLAESQPGDVRLKAVNDALDDFIKSESFKSVAQ